MTKRSQKPIAIAACFSSLGVAVVAPAAEAVPDEYQIVQGEALVADGVAPNPGGVLENDSDVINLIPPMFDGEGQLVMQSDGTFVYTPPAQFIGTVNFSYQVTAIEPVSLISDDADWRFLAPAEDPAVTDPDFHQTWQSPGYNDLTWSPGFGLIGFGSISGLETDTPLPIPPSGSRFTNYFRHTFEAFGGSHDLSLSLIQDDGAIVYLNGQEVVRSPRGGNEFESAPDEFTLTAPAINASAESRVFVHPLEAQILVEGPNLLAISLHNSSATSADLGIHVLDLSGVRIIGQQPVEVTIEVADGQVPPVVKDDRYLLFEGETLDSSIVSSLYNNDGLLSPAGVPYDPISEIVISGSPAGQVTANRDTGHFEFVPAAGFSGTTSFDYQVRDKDGISDPATVTIVVAQQIPEDPPTGNPDSYSVPQGGTLVADSVGANPPGVLADDEHANAADLDEPATYGNLTFNPDGSFDYQPRRNFIGTDTFVYSAQNYVEIGLVDAAAEWRWLHPLDGVDPAVGIPAFHQDWPTPGFDDRTWNTGFGLMGYGIIDSPSGFLELDTFIGFPNPTLRRTAYFRQEFRALPGMYTVEIELSRDDAAIIYLNGTELERSHEPGAVAVTTEPDSYDLMVESDFNALTAIDQEGALNVHRIDGVSLNRDSNLLAISLHNATNSSGAASSSDLGLFVKSFRIVPFRSPATVTITVEDGFTPPELQDDRFVTAVDEALNTSNFSRTLFTNDDLFDDNGAAFDPILSVPVSGPDIGILAAFNAATGNFIYQSPSDFVGTTSFTYQVEDKDGLSDPATVTIEVMDRIDAWRARFFGAGADPSITGNLADPDGDGITNNFEYVLALDPTQPDDKAAVFPQLKVASDGSVGIEFTTRSPTPSDADYWVEASSDLVSWRSLAFNGNSGIWSGNGIITVSEAGPGRNLVRVEDPAASEEPRRYLRLRANFR